jgi:hypothetical protein
MATDQRIRTRAWQLWDQAGRPQGRDHEFWLQAEKEIRQWKSCESSPRSRHRHSELGDDDESVDG